MSKFNLNDKVICTDDRDSDSTKFEDLTKGEVYTVVGLSARSGVFICDDAGDSVFYKDSRFELYTEPEEVPEPHKYADIIKAYADNPKIKIERYWHCAWCPASIYQCISNEDNVSYRIAPTEQELDQLFVE